MTTTAIIKGTAVGLAMIAIGLQATTPAHTNPAVDESQTLERTIPVPAEVTRTLARACNDCHSNRTNWRWYTYVPPISWLTVGHVKDGRDELNFSTFGAYSSRMRETRLRAICQLSRTGAMPPLSYALVHRDARLSPKEIESLCEWTTTMGASASTDTR